MIRLNKFDYFFEFINWSPRCIILQAKVSYECASMESDNVANLAQQLKIGEINGSDLSRMVSEGSITKSERRKISKLAAKPERVLTPRQLLRLEIKTKKSQPKLTREDRHRKYVTDKNDLLRDKQNQKHMTCLHCREHGHMMKFCPALQDSSGKSNIGDKKLFCFNCGEVDHALRNCTAPQTPGYLPFAECFICKQKGHIARDCNDNPNGLYPNGGCCHICQSKAHLVRDCPRKKCDDVENTAVMSNEILLTTSEDLKYQRDDYMEPLVINEPNDDDIDDEPTKKYKKKRRKV